MSHSLTDQKVSVVSLTANMDTRDACASKNKKTNMKNLNESKDVKIEGATQMVLWGE